MLAKISATQAKRETALKGFMLFFESWLAHESCESFD